MGLLALGLLGGISRFLWPTSESPVGKPAIAALPFDSLVGDQSTDRKLEGTVRYLGIKVDDALTIAEQVEL